MAIRLAGFSLAALERLQAVDGVEGRDDLIRLFANRGVDLNPGLRMFV
jgi:hypothetical protein